MCRWTESRYSFITRSEMLNKRAKIFCSTWSHTVRIPIQKWFSRFRIVKLRLLGPTPTVSDSVGLGQDPRISTSNKTPGDLICWCRDHMLRTAALQLHNMIILCCPLSRAWRKSSSFYICILKHKKMKTWWQVSHSLICFKGGEWFHTSLTPHGLKAIPGGSR